MKDDKINNQKENPVEEALRKYIRGLEKRFKAMGEEKQVLMAEISKLEKELHIIQTGSNLQQIIDKMDQLQLRHLKIQVEDKLKSFNH